MDFEYSERLKLDMLDNDMHDELSLHMDLRLRDKEKVKVILQKFLDLADMFDDCYS